MGLGTQHSAHHPTMVHTRRQRCWLPGLGEPSQTFHSLYCDNHKSGQLSQELEITIQSKGFEYMMKWLQTMFNSLPFIE